MKSRSSDMNTRVVAVAAAVLLLGATPTPSPAPTVAPIAAPSIPPGAVNGIVNTIIRKVTGDIIAPLGADPNHVRGQVTYFHRFDMQLAMPLQTYKQIHLHQGTVINPRGASIQDGENVDVQGTVNGDGSINANEITILH
jgi:hypothetical protein